MSSNRWDTQKRTGGKIYFSVSVRFTLVIAVILAITLLIINSLLSDLASRDLVKTAREGNYTVNIRSASQAENLLYSIRADAFILLDYIRLAGKDSYLARQAAALFFEHRYNIAAIVVPGYTELINNQFFIANEISPGSVAVWLSGESISVDRAKQGTPIIINPSVEFGLPLTAMFFPWQQNAYEQAVIILFSPDAFAEIFSAGGNSTLMANSEGDVLIHPDYNIMRTGVNMFNQPLFSALVSGKANEIDLVYEEDGVKYLGAGKKLAMGDLVVLSTIEYDLPVSGISRGVHRNIYLIITVVFLCLILIRLLSKSITVPLRQMEKSIAGIMNGDFSVKLKYRFPDEIGALSEKFNEMSNSLEKRERFLDAHNRSVKQNADNNNL